MGQRMNYFSDALTIGIVLLLLFGSIALYLYTRIQQTEQKNSLLESILLDLKMNAEMKSYAELPADEMPATPPPSPPQPTFQPEQFPSTRSLTPPASSEATIIDVEDVEQYSSVIADAVNEVAEETTSTSEVIEITPMDALDSYDGMKLKELQDLARSRGIAVSAGMKKQAVIDALRASDRSSSMKSGSSSLIDHSEILTME